MVRIERRNWGCTQPQFQAGAKTLSGKPFCIVMHITVQIRMRYNKNRECNENCIVRCIKILLCNHNHMIGLLEQNI